MWWPLFLAPSPESNPSKPLVLNKNNWDEVLRFVNLLKNHDKNISSSSKNLDFISEFDYFLYNFLMLARILNPANAPGSTRRGGGVYKRQNSPNLCRTVGGRRSIVFIEFYCRKLIGIELLLFRSCKSFLQSCCSATL